MVFADAIVSPVKSGKAPLLSVANADWLKYTSPILLFVPPKPATILSVPLIIDIV